MSPMICHCAAHITAAAYSLHSIAGMQTTGSAKGLPAAAAAAAVKRLHVARYLHSHQPQSP